MIVKRGEIYWAEFDPVKGSEQGGLRPALIVQQDVGNQYSPTTVVVTITRTLPLRPYPFVVVVEPEESGLSARSAINCSQITTIQKDEPGSRLRPWLGEHEVRPIGWLSAQKMAEVNRALRYNLGL
ncbi:MAG: type II toxin-antitoxin system PemK/MazF family toxin [Chloroflexi bacterium]|nr:type II toxin-antitoxin system PemK/MazF family toxin [Chloroflexota bacterium]